MNRAIFFVFLLCSCFLISCGSDVIVEQSDNTVVVKDINESVQPLSKKNIDDLKNEVTSFVSNYDGNYGIVYYDINSEDKIEINGDAEFFGASTYKVLMNIVAYEYVKSGVVTLDDMVSYTDADYEEGGSVIGEGSYSLQYLLDCSILYSDNIASNMICRYLGGYTPVMLKAGEILEVEETGLGNVQTPNKLLKALKFIYENKDDEYYKQLINNMENTVFHDRLDKFLPNDIVAHKVGMYDAAIHDVGIIFDEEPYILCIYTENMTSSYEFISELSSLIYKFRKENM